MTSTERLTRLELYDLVWSQSISQLAPRFQMSDKGLAKKCEAHDIPRPPVGYWMKVQYGRSVKKTPLPKLDDPSLEIVYFNGKVKDPVGDTLPEHFLSKDQLVFISSFSFDSRVQRYHDDIQVCRSHVVSKEEHLRLDFYGRVNYPDTIDNPGLKVTPESMQRASKFLQKLIDAFNKLGWKFIRSSDSGINQGFARFSFKGAILKVAVKEIVVNSALDKITNEDFSSKTIDEDEAIHLALFGRPCKHYKGTGDLEFLVDCNYPGFTKRWRDDKNGYIEEKLLSISMGLSRLFERERLKNIERDETQRQWELEREAVQARKLTANQERKLTINQERKHQTNLLALASRYEKVISLRKLIQAVEESESQSDKITEWLIRAHGIADRLDPTINDSMLFDKSFAEGDSKLGV